MKRVQYSPLVKRGICLQEVGASSKMWKANMLQKLYIILFFLEKKCISSSNPADGQGQCAVLQGHGSL